MRVQEAHTWWVLLILAILASACSRGNVAIDFGRTEENPQVALAPPSGERIRVAVAPVLSAQPTFAMYQDLVDYMAQRLGEPVELVMGKTYAEINDLVKSGEVTLALVCTNPYLQGREDFGMELLVVPEVNSGRFYYSLLIVRSDLDIHSLEELKGRSFAFTDPLSNSGRLAPLYELALVGAKPETFFGRTIFTYSHDNSIRAVSARIVDAAAVDSIIYDQLSVMEPNVTAMATVVERWGPFGINPVVVNPKLSPELKARLRGLFLEMDEDSQGIDILRRLMVDRFVMPDDHIYDSVREMRAYLREHGLQP